jgi:hypothetical protein
MTVIEYEVFESAIKQFGIEKQMIKCVEELAELQKEICKQALGQGSKNKIIEEMADVSIMLDQMLIGLGISSYAIKPVREYKVNRLNDRLVKMDGAEKSKAIDQEKESQNEPESRNCRYFSITRDILTKLVKDPCETCDTSHRNWKPKEDIGGGKTNV